MIFAIDSNTCIWAIKGHGDQGMIERAAYLLAQMDAGGHILLVPTIVLAEVLAPEPLEKHVVIMDKLAKNTIIADFDLRAASIYANMFRNKIEELKKFGDEIGVDNQKMKADHLILASAIAQGANCIYSHDKGIRAFGQKYIDVRDLPSIPPRQPLLFDDQSPY